MKTTMNLRSLIYFLLTLHICSSEKFDTEEEERLLAEEQIDDEKKSKSNTNSWMNELRLMNSSEVRAYI